MIKPFSIIVCIDKNLWIWKNWKLAWHLSSDLKYFKETTTKTKDLNKKNAVIMWRITWESIPDKFKPLKWRLNIVLSSNENLILPDWVLNYSSLENAQEYLNKDQSVESVFVIWWASIYKQAISSKFLEKIYITEIMSDFQCDTFFLKFDKFHKTKESKILEEDWIRFRFCEYEK